MLYMNDYDIHLAKQRHGAHPVIGKAIAILEALIEQTNAHSDGWAHWKKPCAAARKLQELIQRGEGGEGDLKVALRPIKAFYTKAGYAAGMKLPEGI